MAGVSGCKNIICCILSTPIRAIPSQYRLLCLLLLVLLAGAQTAIGAGTTERWNYGLSLYFVQTDYRAEIDSLPGIPEAREVFTSGTGGSFSLSGMLRIPLAAGWSGSFRAGITRYNGQFTALQVAPILPDGTPVPMTVRHTLDASFLLASFLPSVEYTPFGRMTLSAGPEIGIVAGNTVVQKEEIIDPPGATWVSTKTPLQVLFDGELSDISPLQVALTAGAGYSFPLNSARTLHIAPEVYISLPLGVLRETGSWSAMSYRVGASLLFAPLPAPPPVFYDTVRTSDTTINIVAGIDEERIVAGTPIITTVQDTLPHAVFVHTSVHEQFVRQIPELKPLLSATITASFVLDNGQETKAAKVTMEEFIVHKYTPLLPYVFFAEQSSVIPSRYKSLPATDAAAFSIHHYNTASTLDIYYHVLNILGERMHRLPQATIVVTGYTADERGTPALSERRARAVANYLSNVWNIPPSRITIRARALPDRLSAMNQQEGVEENRRVEITGSDPALFEPVVLTDTIRTVDPPTVRFRPRLFSEAGIRTWRILIAQEEKLLKELRGEGVAPSAVDWAIAQDDIRPLASLPLEYRLVANDSAAQSFTTPLNTIQFEQITISKKKQERRADKLIDRFSLLLFDYDAAVLSQRHSSTLNFIRTKLKPSSTVRITGTTDRVGDETYNLQLSERRAHETARALMAESALVSGAGEDTTTFPNDLPEGRLYSRTVRISIETPLDVR